MANLQVIGSQTVATVNPCDFPGQHGAHTAIVVANAEIAAPAQALLQGIPSGLGDAAIQASVIEWRVAALCAPR